MPMYVTLAKLTDQGIRNYKDTVTRAEKWWAAIKEAGGRLIQEVWTTGDYDVVALFEAPDDETAASLSLQVSSLGNVRTTTSRAFSAEEVKKIIAKNPR
ncbi:MAG TPA: GYD domain-containing protein [Kofleriaceae bacterium]|nr:GYD domain-containing protein [Kofleriaceae bacterium]